MTTERTTDQLAIARHPDLAAMQERYARSFETPRAWASEGLLLLAALYAAISPWIVGFHSTSRGLAVSDLIVGISLAVIAFGFAEAALHMHGMAWVTPLLGVWLIISPWIVQGTTTTAGLVCSNVIGGACVFLFGATMAGMARRGA
jgi:hypothetical protein